MKMRQKIIVMMVITLTSALTFGVSGCGPLPLQPNGHLPLQPNHTGSFGPCEPVYDRSAGAHVVRWTPNGTHVLFGLEKELYLVDSKGLSLRRLTDANPPRDVIRPESRPLVSGLMKHGLRADISPGGLRVVYTSCEYPTQQERRSEHSVHRYPDWRDDPYSYNYEIAIVNIDGAGKRRLTENSDLDIHPTWSPDGSLIAFISYARSTPDRLAFGHTLYTMRSDGSNVRELTPTFPQYTEPRQTQVSLRSPPKWSPDGERIAFLVSGPDEIALYTVKADGSNLTRIAATRHEPSWSPDSQRLAFLADRGDGLALRTAAADGSDIREIRRKIRSWDDVFAWTYAISWSPSGHEFMLIPVGPSGGTIFVVGTDGSMIGQFGGDYAAWSPDGSRIAVAMPGSPSFRALPLRKHYRGALWTTAPDGSDIRLLAETTDGESSWVAAGVALSDRIAQCESDGVVPNHADNPGLVEDCKTLQIINDAFPEGATNWESGKSIWKWRGVFVGGQPPRVVALRLWEEIVGLLRPEIGNLSALRSLEVWGGSGAIPPELGQISNLRSLTIFSGSGPIPPELGQLSNLRFLDIRGGSGPIPPELGQLSELRELTLAYAMTGGIPPELGNLEKLESLRVGHVSFLEEMSECFPASLVNSLRILSLQEAWGEYETIYETIEDLNAKLGTELKPC